MLRREFPNRIVLELVTCWLPDHDSNEDSALLLRLDYGRVREGSAQGQTTMLRNEQRFAFEECH
jgi:hypothetical protein